MHVFEQIFRFNIKVLQIPFMYICPAKIIKQFKENMMRFKFIVLSMALIIAVNACSKENKENQAPTKQANVHQVVVQEAVQVNSYTYLRVKEGDKEYWMAATTFDVKNGETLYYTSAMEMKKFESKELKKTFDSIFFVDNISKIPPANVQEGLQATPQKPTIEKENVNIQPAAGGATIAQIFSNPNSYSNKSVSIKGKIVKVNSGIMGKNWAHIQDGTSSGKDFDLTVTTKDEVKVGDVVTFEGTLSVNKDFGYGYSYKVLLEDAKLKK